MRVWNRPGGAGTLAGLLLAMLVSSNVHAQQPSWASSRAADLTTQASAHAQAGDLGLARKRLTEALLIDGSYGPAYLELARLREMDGDPQEALRVYGSGIERIVGFGDGYAARAMLLDRLGRPDAAASDMQNALALSPLNPLVQQRALDFYIRRKAWAASLLVARMNLQSQLGLADSAALRKARLQVAALSKLAGETDPALAGRDDQSWERRSIAAIVRRLGL